VLRVRERWWMVPPGERALIITFSRRANTAELGQD
jgi:hypothetical protein